MKIDHIIFENLLLFDIKLWVEKGIASLPDSFDRIMKIYELEKGDYENSVLPESVFIRLGWSNISKDTINSFWETFTCALVKLSKENTWTYSNASKGQCTESIYSFNNDFNIMYSAWNPKTKIWGRFLLSKRVFGTKFFLPRNIHKEKAEILLEEFPEFK